MDTDAPEKSTREACAELDCSPTTLHKFARELKVGRGRRGRIGFKFTDAEIAAIREAMNPPLSGRAS